MFRPRIVLISILTVSLLVGCGDENDPTQPQTDVDGYMESLPAWDDFSPQLESEDVDTGDTEVEIELVGNQIYICSETPCSITETPDDIVTFNPSSEILYLGSLIQGDSYLLGLGTLEELPIRQRAPLTISIDLLFPDNTRTVENPNLGSVNQAIGELITNAELAGHVAGSVISFQKKTYHSVEQGMLSLGLSVKYMGASVRTQIETERTVEQNSLTAYFRQRMFTTSLVLPQTPGAFFSEDFTREHLDEQIELDRIGPDNLPVYVSNIVWGRILVMTMTSSSSKEEMRLALEASYHGIVDVEGGVTAEQMQLLQESEIKIVAVGGSAESALALIRSGNLADYFAESAPLTSAAPISFSLRSLTDNRVAKVSETTEYVRTECSSSPVSYYNDYDEWRSSVVMFMQGEDGTLETTAQNLVMANEVSSPPGGNQGVGRWLTFEMAQTGFPCDLYLRAHNAEFVNNDNEIHSSYHPSLSVGDVDNNDNDDFEVGIGQITAGKAVIALGIKVGDNSRESGEALRVYGANDLLLDEFTEGLPNTGSNGGYGFMGVVSLTPLTKFVFNESSSGGDDICIQNIYYAVVDESLLYYE